MYIYYIPINESHTIQTMQYFSVIHFPYYPSRNVIKKGLLYHIYMTTAVKCNERQTKAT